MASLPSYVLVLLDGYAEDQESGVTKSEMERGLSKLRIGQSRVAKTISVNLVFESASDANNFEDWYFGEIKRIGFFDWLDPRTNMLRSVRFKDGALGQIQPMSGGFGMSKRSAVLEYLR
ncbi:hypothetical protein [Comamonas terrae]|uniref:Uncharacterized protein n=1 Tax=Comamonas terrae TaxID=673548 RepID=A0ABW5UQG5_9BURK|nr:hypothetical protein [Comamonas terrae]